VRVRRPAGQRHPFDLRGTRLVSLAARELRRALPQVRRDHGRQRHPDRRHRPGEPVDPQAGRVHDQARDDQHPHAQRRRQHRPLDRGQHPPPEQHPEQRRPGQHEPEQQPTGDRHRQWRQQDSRARRDRQRGDDACRRRGHSAPVR
jgi:hypothetical protein